MACRLIDLQLHPQQSGIEDGEVESRECGASLDELLNGLVIAQIEVPHLDLGFGGSSREILTSGLPLFLVPDSEDQM